MEFDNPWLNISQLLEASREKKIIFWGCDTWFEKTMKMHKFNVSHLVDIAKNQQGAKSHHGYDVLDPSTLKTLKNKDKYYVIITTSAFYEVIKQIKSYGYKPGKDFSFTPLLQNFKIIDDILSHEQTLLLSSSDSVKDSPDEGGGIYTFHIPSGKMEKKLSGITRGFDRYNGNYYVVDALKGVRILDKNFKEIDSFELPEHSVPHSLVIDKKNRLIYVVLSQQDKVCAYDLKTYKLVRTITLSDKYEKTGIYHHHMNDICLDGSSLYISMFSKTGNVQKYFYDSAIVEYDLDGDKVVGSVMDGLWQPHSVMIINNQLCFLDSMRGNFHLYPQKIETHFNGFVRGLDFDGKYYYIGQSIHRYFDRMMGHSDNISVDCGVFVLDNSSKACKFYPAPTLKDINTIKLLKPISGVN
jgi:hypothetical protein